MFGCTLTGAVKNGDVWVVVDDGFAVIVVVVVDDPDPPIVVGCCNGFGCNWSNCGCSSR